MTLALVLATGSVFDPLYTALGRVLAWLYDFVPNYAVAIILLTVAVRLVLYPLTVKQTKSMQAMQRLQPEIKRLQQKYKGDKQKLNEEMMKFYKENSVNPLAGCLPLLLQMPLFIVLYRLIHDLVPGKASASALATAAKTGKHLCGTAGHFLCPKHVPLTSSIFHALSHANGKMVAWGMNLAVKPSAAHGGAAIPLYILVALTVVTGYYQQRQMTARTPESAQNPQTQMMGKIFPLFFGFISLQIPAGVVLYFVVSNAWQIGQQALIFRQQDAAPPAKPKSTASPPVTSPPNPQVPSSPQPAATSPNGPAAGSRAGAGANRSRRRRRKRRGR